MLERTMSVRNTATESIPATHRQPENATDGAAHGPARPAYVLSAVLAVVTLLATIPTIALDGVLHGPAAMAGSARGTALVMAVVGVPVLIAGMALTNRGSARALLIWLGALGYLVYNAVMLLFGTPFNSLFLLYVSTFSLALWSMVAVLASIDIATVGALRSASRVERGVAIYVWAIVSLNTLIWLKGVVGGLLDSAAPPFLDGTGLTTLPTYVQDLAVWLPLAAVAAWRLWCRKPWGVVVAGSLLVMWVIESLGIAADQAWGHAADPSSGVVSGDVVPAFVLLAVIGVAPIVLLMRRMRHP
jgi:hypothetical protein